MMETKPQNNIYLSLQETHVNLSANLTRTCSLPSEQTNGGKTSSLFLSKIQCMNYISPLDFSCSSPDLVTVQRRKRFLEQVTKILYP
jgi:hypothetical protein